jgi:arylsulfatase A-like enzyme
MQNKSHTSQPNIIMIVADHVAFAGHYGKQSYRPNWDYHWPNLERISKQGAWFDNAYCVTPVCTPSRASLLTGKRPDKHGMRWNCEYPIPDNRRDFAEDEQLYSDILAKQGYQNYYFGKWHCGVGKLPEDFGLQGWSLPEYGNLYGSEAYKSYLHRIGEPQPQCLIEHHLMRPGLNGTSVLMDPVEPWDFMDGAGILRGSSEVHEQFFMADMAIKQLEKLTNDAAAKPDSTTPFSMLISFWGPHHPYYPSQEFSDMVNPSDITEYPSFRETLADKPLRYKAHRDLRCLHRAHERWSEWETWQRVIARCYAQGLQTDAAIGRIEQAMQRLGLADNTLLVITADHGDGIASHGGVWDKYSTFTEEVAKVPLVMRWPEKIPANQTVISAVNLTDVAATLWEAAEANPIECGDPELMTAFEQADGKSLLGLCRGQQQREHMVLEHYGHSGDVSFQKICYQKQWKYVAVYGDEDELYDLETDPFELNNLLINDGDGKKYAAVIRELRDLIIHDLTSRRQKRAESQPPAFLEKGIVFSSVYWPREETLLLHKLNLLQGYPT